MSQVHVSTSGMEEQMEDMASQSQDSPSTTPSQTQEDTGEDSSSLMPKDELKRFFLGAPILSLSVGGALLVIEVTVIVLVLAAPATVGVTEDVALTPAQRGVLGGVSILMLIEAVLCGIVDIGRAVQVLHIQYTSTCVCT